MQICNPDPILSLTRFCPKGKKLKDNLLEAVTTQYLESGDFNGLSFHAITRKFAISLEVLRNHLEELLKADKIEVIYGDYHPNPHIKIFEGFKKEDQIKKLTNTELLQQSCMYPSSSHLKDIVPEALFKDTPYSRELALGAGQLDFRAFDVSVLEFYRNDPRYHYDNNDINGWISVHDEFFETDKMASSDQALLESFGFCYTEQLDRAVAVFLRYLHDLSPEHQQIWKAKELVGEYELHPDYYRNSIIGDWGTRLSIFDAFIMELAIINKMCTAMGKPPLFRNTFENSRPREFGFLLRPTLSEFNSFIHLLDKMMSDNLNKDFFKCDIELEDEEVRKDGKIVVKPKGTIRLLQEWLGKNFTPIDPTPLVEMFTAFKRIRGLRQKPAHSIRENEFDQHYFKQQRLLMKEAYNAIRIIRLIFANYPQVVANPPEVHKLLYEGKIWDI